MKRITIKFPYLTEEVYIGPRLIRLAAKRIGDKKYDKVVAVVDRNVMRKQPALLASFLDACKARDTITINPIAKYKDIKRCQSLIGDIAKCRLTRKSCLIAIGGGYVGDLVGFIASIYMRGIDFIQIPTTLMAMGDAVIGKVAVNFAEHKNLLGSFYSPRFIFCDTAFLKTLPPKEIAYGLVEIWKHALLKESSVAIQKIEDSLRERRNVDFLTLVDFSLRVKKKFIERDYNDLNGSHKAVSLGHTFANYFERRSKMRHGCAVFYGIMLATLLSYELGMITEKKKKRILSTASLFERRIGLLDEVQKKLKAKDFLRAMKFDKINHHNTYSFVLLLEKGYIVKRDVPPGPIKKSLENFKKMKI
jgi:3-dehydroquinate synthase